MTVKNKLLESAQHKQRRCIYGIPHPDPENNTNSKKRIEPCRHLFCTCSTALISLYILSKVGMQSAKLNGR